MFCNISSKLDFYITYYIFYETLQYKCFGNFQVNLIFRTSHLIEDRIRKPKNIVFWKCYDMHHLDEIIDR